MKNKKLDARLRDEDVLLAIRRAFYAGFEAGRLDGAQRGINPAGVVAIRAARFLEWMEKAADDISHRTTMSEERRTQG